MGVTTSSNSAVTYECLAASTLNSPATTFTFSSIPSTYTDLVVITNGKMNVSGTQNLYYRFNPGSGGTYSDVFLYGTGSSVLSNRHLNGTYALIGDFQDDYCSHIGHILNYANSNVQKVALSQYGYPGDVTMISAIQWQATAAISTLEVSLGGTTNFASGTTCSLYGIKAA